MKESISIADIIQIGLDHVYPRLTISLSVTMDDPDLEVNELCNSGVHTVRFNGEITKEVRKWWNDTA